MARNVPTPSGAEIIDVMLLRQAIGVLGVALPFLLWFGGLAARVALQPSISRYYHTQMHDVFVGVLCAIGLGLFDYAIIASICKYHNSLPAIPISRYCFRNPLMGSRSSLTRFGLAPERARSRSS